MNYIRLLIVALATLVLLAACTPTVDEARAEYCEALGAYGQAVIQLRAINESSTVDEYRTALAEVERAWTRVQETSTTLAEAQGNALRDANQQLAATVNDIPSDATIGDARATIRSATLETIAAYNEIMTTVCRYGQQP